MIDIWIFLIVVLRARPATVDQFEEFELWLFC